MLHAQILGPLTLCTSNEERSPSSNKQKQLLSLLLFNLPYTTSAETVIDELWMGGPPKSAMGTLQTYVCHLRNFLADITGLPSRVIAEDILVYRSRGYSIDPSAVSLDVTLFREFERQVYRAVEQREYAAVVRHCESALALWRGQALMDVRAGQHVQAEIDGLESAKLALIDTKIEAKIALGKDREVLGELSTMVSRHPLNERVHYNYMRALSNSEHRARSLEVYQAIRTTMVEQLGIEPSTALRRLHESILNGHVPEAYGDLGNVRALRNTA